MSKIKVVTLFYREEFLAQHFLNHYSFADSIIVLGGNSPDRTRAIFEADPRVTWIDLDMPEGVDDLAKTAAVNHVVKYPDPIHDWTIVADSDELVWPHAPLFPEALGRNSEVSRFLDGVPQHETVLMANMWQVFRHQTDSDLTTELPPALQRRHGETDRETGGREGYRKPAVIRTNQNLQYGVGQHHIDSGQYRISEQFSFDGAHWAMADPSFVVRRIRDRRDRISPRNRAGQLGGHLFKVTPEELLKHMEERRNLPRLF